VIARCAKRHRHQEDLTFLRLIDKQVPAALEEVHLVVDNYATYKHAKVRAWLSRHPRFHVHFTPTYSSWINQVERSFGLISLRVIKRSTFISVNDLVRCIHAFTREHAKHASPFVWVATAQSVLYKNVYPQVFPTQDTSCSLDGLYPATDNDGGERVMLPRKSTQPPATSESASG